jgi:methyl-accepting chemotaxis protein
MKSLSVGRKFFLTCGMAMALTLSISVVSLRSLSSLGATMQRLVDTDARKQFLAGEIDVALTEFLAEERGIIRRAAMQDKQSVEKYNQDFRESSSRIRKRIEEMAPLLRTSEERELFEQLRTASAQIVQNHSEFMSLLTRHDVSSEDVPIADHFLTGTATPLLRQTKPIAEKLVGLQTELMAASGKAATASVAWSRWLTILMIALSFMVAGVVVLIVRQINATLRRAVSELSQGSRQTASAASQVSASSQSLAQGASQQAASIEETSASSEEISSMARRNTENSRGAAELMARSHQKLSDANQSLEQMVLAMGEINASSDKISRIIRTIDEIAFQTNILALNAAVEAARAGEAGMGFAVVADEVRNLSQRCAQAAHDTAPLIEESVVKSNQGKLRVDQVAVAIRSVAEDADKVKSLVHEVQQGSQEQSQGMDQISQAIAQMSEVTQAAAAGTEQCAAAAEQLTAQSEAMREIVDRLSAMVNGG